MKWLLRTGCASGKDRGVLGSGSFRMKLRDKFLRYMFSSQETPLRLEKRRMRHVTENSSIQLFSKALGMGFVVLSLNLAKAEGQKSTAAGAIEVGIERMMLKNLFDQMRKSQSLLEGEAGADNPFAPSHAERVFKSFQEDLLIDKLAESQPLGIGKIAAKQFSKSGAGVSD